MTKDNGAYNQTIELCGKKFYSEIKNGHARGNDYISFTVGIELKNGARIFCKKAFFGYNDVNINESKSFIYHTYKVCKQVHEFVGDIYVKVKSTGTFGGLTTYSNKTSFDFDFIDIIDKTTNNNHEQLIQISGYVDSSFDNTLVITSGDELAKVKNLNVEIDKSLNNSAKIGLAYVLQGELIKSVQNEVEFSWDIDYEEREELIVRVKPIGIKRGFIFGKVQEEKQLPIVENKEKKITVRTSINNGAF